MAIVNEEYCWTRFHQVRLLMRKLFGRARKEGCEYALDNLCCASDFVASGFQFACGRRFDPLAAGCGVGGFSHQLV
jgi:hypothetical protein